MVKIMMMMMRMFTERLAIDYLILLFEGKKKPHIKKPLNAFMLYMKEMRPKVRTRILQN